MARLCPQCGEIHFETSASPLPSACRKCNADMNEASGLMPAMQLEEAQSATPRPKATPKQVFQQWAKTPGFKGIIIGVLVLTAAGVMLYMGWKWHTGVKEVTATCHVAPADTPKWAKRNHITATYSIGTKKYPQYPGVRSEGTAFPMYYLPDDPATGYEAKPFLWLVIGGKVLLIGLGVLSFALMKFFVGRAQIADCERTMAQAG